MSDSKTPNEKLGGSSAGSGSLAYEKAHGSYEPNVDPKEKSTKLSSSLPMAPQKKPFKLDGGGE